MSSTGSWVGVKVKNDDGRRGVIENEFFDITDRTLCIHLDDAKDGDEPAFVSLSANGKDSGETGWRWLAGSGPLQDTWIMLGEHNDAASTNSKEMCIQNVKKPKF